MLGLPPRLAQAIIATVCAGWLTSTIASTLLTGYEVPPSLNAVFMLIAGAVATQLGGDKKGGDPK